MSEMNSKFIEEYRGADCTEGGDGQFKLPLAARMAIQGMAPRNCISLWLALPAYEC